MLKYISGIQWASPIFKQQPFMYECKEFKVLLFFKCLVVDFEQYIPIIKYS